MSWTDLVPLFLPLTVGACLIGLAVLVARTGWPQRHNRAFAALYFLSGTKSICEGLLSTHHTALVDGQDVAVVWADQFHAAAPLFPTALVLVYISAIALFFMVPLLLAFVLGFPQPWAPFEASLAVRLGLFVPTLVSIAILASSPVWLTKYFLGAEIVATGVTVVAVVLLARARRTASDAIARKQAGYLLLGFLPSFVATWLITLDDIATAWGSSGGMPGLHHAIVGWVSPIASPLLEVAAAALVAFAILKYRLLSFELKVKGGAKYVIMTLIVGALLFGVSTYVGNFVLQGAVFSFAGPTGSAILSGLFTILLFKPVEKLSGGITDRLFPETRSGNYPQRRAEEIYHAQASLVLRDAEVTPRELDFLRRLREQLGIDKTRAQAIEEQVERSLGVDTELGLTKPA